MSKISHIVFDAANTLIHKPTLWDKWVEVLQEGGYKVEMSKLKYHHKLLSESIKFPDRTNKDFYAMFNAEVLLSLGIVPSNEVLEKLFSKCSYLPWELFEDAHSLTFLDIPMSILSNFNSSLKEKMQKLFPAQHFHNIFISEEIGCGKPDIVFFQKAISSIGQKPENILYIGDSIKLDVIPGKKTGMKTLLIDRENMYPALNERISSLAQIKEYL